MTPSPAWTPPSSAARPFDQTQAVGGHVAQAGCARPRPGHLAGRRLESLEADVRPAPALARLPRLCGTTPAPRSSGGPSKRPCVGRPSGTQSPSSSAWWSKPRSLGRSSCGRRSARWLPGFAGHRLSIAWFPLALVLFKLSEGAITFVVVVGAAPSIANGVVAGVDQVPPLLLRSGRMLGASHPAVAPRDHPGRDTLPPRRSQAGLGVRLAQPGWPAN